MTRLRISLALAFALVGCGPPSVETSAPRGAEAFGYAPTTYEAHREALKRTTIDDFTVRYLDVGEGPVVLLVHGVPTSSWVYRKVAAALVADGFRVIAPDLVGWGASDKARDGDALAPARQGARLLALMDALAIESWVQVVHDAGGPWSFEMLDAAGPRVTGLVILNTVLFEEGWKPPLKFREGGGMSRLVRKALEGPRNDRWAKLTVAKGTERADLPRDAGLVEGYRAPLSEGAGFSVQQFVFDFRDMCEALPGYHATLRRFQGPIGVVWGMEDGILRGKEQLPRLRGLEGVELLDVQALGGVNHFLQEERPEAVVDMVRAVSAKTDTLEARASVSVSN